MPAKQKIIYCPRCQAKGFYLQPHHLWRFEYTFLYEPCILCRGIGYLIKHREKNGRGGDKVVDKLV